MEKNVIRDQVVAKIAAQFKKDLTEIRDEDHLAKRYGAKSHDLIQLSASIQAALGIKVSYAQTRKANTVGEWVELAVSLAK